MSNFLDEDVPSPEDFPPPSNAPGLRELDEALRCNICKELYSAPVTIPCGHCFCSLELPRLAKQECPVCRAPANESQIRKNAKLEDAVRAWNLARPLVLNLVKEEERRRKRKEARQSTPPPVDGYRNRVGQASPKKRKLSPQTDGEESDVVEVTASQLAKSNLAGFGIIEDKGKRRTRSEGRSSSPPPRPSSSKSPQEATCPSCGKMVPFSTINDHLDSGCKLYLKSDAKQKQKQKDGWGNIFGNPETGSSKAKGKGRSREDLPIEDTAEPLPKVSYGTLKPKRLKEMLQELDLPSTGERDVLQARHQRWIIIFNANLDASERKSTNQLKQDLAAWEKAKQSKKPTVDEKKYERENHQVYADLIARAKASAPPKAQPRSSPNEGPLSSPISVDGDSSSDTATLDEKPGMEVDP
ncbi:E3 ubiquitin-protein ligase rad18 [Steccherinum ochraceum]|uniref:Postreplication repair E3 ubiquitin-protein ligase RAD18 n=1 Tax=Steccherinum ochraceum TaxID=92696 RepID=A0A4R0RP29_9APHY|nr:E3 ubiquitin-protein ligase rad18 [Steccherinum ochraceum]